MSAPPPLALRILITIVLLAIPVGLLAWGARTCRSLWRRGTTPWGRLVYNYGVRGFGLSTAVSITVIGGYLGATALATSPADSLRCAVVGAIFAAIFGTPVGLGLGYLWGTSMAKFAGLEPDADRKNRSG
jgi:hypothetical protein